MAIENTSQDLADLLVTKGFDPVYTDERGMDSSQAEAKIFSFDWKASSGKNYGTAVVVMGDDNDLQFFFGDNLGRSIERPQDKKEWFDFLEQLSNFATQHRYTFSPQDINQLKHTMTGMAAIKEGLFEGYYGTRRISYMGEQTDARLVIKHNKILGENDKRYRYVESLFIETADNERFKLPFKNLTGGRAMLEHVRQGGKPYDIRGAHINEMVQEMSVLARFNRASQQRVFEGVTAELVESAQQYYQQVRENLNYIGGTRGYQSYFESWSPADINDETALVEDLKTMFIEQTLDTRIEAALPTLARIQQKGTAMKEAQIFENWINNLSEGTWALPDTPEAQEKLNTLMASELIVGPDATNATELLYDVIGDDQLFDILGDLAERDPRANIWDDTDVQARLAELGIQTPQSTEAEPADVAQDTAPDDEDYYALPDADGDRPQGMAENTELNIMLKYAGVPVKESVLTDSTGHTLDHILQRFSREVADFEAGGEIDDDLYHALYDYYFDDMPYGTKKARDGDPYEWVSQRLADELGMNEEKDIATPGEKALATGLGATAGGFAGMMLGGASGTPGAEIGKAVGAALGGTTGYQMAKDLGNKNVVNKVNQDSNWGVNEQNTTEGSCNATMEGEYCPEHGLAECAMEEGVPGALGGAGLGSIAGAALGGPAGVPVGAAIGGALGAFVPHDSKPTTEGWKGELAGGTLGGVGGTVAGSALGALAAGPIGAGIGGVVGGAAGSTGGAMIGREMTKEAQLNEIAPLLAAGARAVMPLLSKIGPKLGQMASGAGKAGAQVAGKAAKAGADVVGKTATGIGRGTVDVAKSAAQSAAQNAGTIGLGIGAYQAITDIANGIMGGIGEVYHDAGDAAGAIAQAVGNAVDGKTIAELAAVAVKYAIPIGILLAVVYGGKKLIDKVMAESVGTDSFYESKEDDTLLARIKSLALIR
jgi:hypothetical protein